MMVPMGRFELPTSPLPRECSTPELHGRIMFGAGEGNRTLTVSLEGFCSTIELHPLFHLIAPSVIGGGRRIRTFEVEDGRFTVCSLWPLGNPSINKMELAIGIEPTTC